MSLDAYGFPHRTLSEGLGSVKTNTINYRCIYDDVMTCFLHLLFTRAKVIERDLKVCLMEKTTHLLFITFLCTT